MMKSSKVFYSCSLKSGIVISINTNHLPQYQPGRESVSLYEFYDRSTDRKSSNINPAIFGVLAAIMKIDEKLPNNEITLTPTPAGLFPGGSYYIDIEVDYETHIDLDVVEGVLSSIFDYKID